MITPQTEVRLLQVPLEIDAINQITFSNEGNQYNYFSALPYLDVGEDFTYQRKDGVIRVQAKYDDLLRYNYVMYRNDAYSRKWFYAFISGLEYLNDEVTAVKIKTDVWQTWQFDLSYKPVFVEREHVNDDTIGVHTIEENIDVGEYVINSSKTLMPDGLVTDATGAAINTRLPIFFQVTELTGALSVTSSLFSRGYNSIFSGLYYFAVSTYDDARKIINLYDSNGKGEAIIAIFHAPVQFLQGANVNGETGAKVYIPANTGGISTLLSTSRIDRPSSLNGYTPKNNKLFTYPFAFVYATNNVGIETTFRYEDFAGASPSFYIGGALGQGCSTKLCPVNYKSYASGAEVFEYGVSGAKYPICAWSSDYYTNWVTQNAVNIGVGLANTAISTGIGFATFGIAGGIVGGAASIFSDVSSAIAKNHEASIVPDQGKGNVNTSDLLPGWQRYFTVMCMSVRSELAKIADDYLSMYGYKVNAVKSPNITGRRNWNFVKTIGAYIDAKIPQDDLQEIKQMFDNGITFWHNPATFGDYSQNNDII